MAHKSNAAHLEDSFILPVIARVASMAIVVLALQLMT